jgi:hypothetical protein
MDSDRSPLKGNHINIYSNSTPAGKVSEDQAITDRDYPSIPLNSDIKLNTDRSAVSDQDNEAYKSSNSENILVDDSPRLNQEWPMSHVNIYNQNSQKYPDSELSKSTFSPFESGYNLSYREKQMVPNPADIRMSLPPILVANAEYVFPDSLPFFSSEQMIKLQKASSLSRRISWLAIVDCILVSFILYFGIFYLILIVIFLPVIGFFSSRRFHRCLSIFYLFYSILILAMRCSLIIMYRSIAAFVIQGIIILIELYITYSVFRFLQVIKTLTPVERDFLLGRPVPHHAQHEIENASVKCISDPPCYYEQIIFEDHLKK